MTTSRIIKAFTLIVFLVFLSTMVSCGKETVITINSVSSSKPVLTPLSSLMPNRESTYPASFTSTPTREPILKEVFFEGQGLTWLECNVPQDQFHNWSYGESCLGITLPKWSKEDKRMSGKHFQNKDSPEFDYRIQIGEDIYETNNRMSVVDLEGENYLIKFEYALLKNGTIISSKTAPIIPYSPN
ncbi:MAG: hypothetical protein ACK2TV_07995, partial [Anaerolineales bacterium]